MSVAVTLHLLSALVWVGGMFFAWMCLRPVAGTLLGPPERLSLWLQVFDRFFPWVWACVVVLLATGYWMIFSVFGGMAASGLYVHVMQGIGIVMMLLFMYVFFVPYPRLRRAVAIKDWPGGGAQLGKIRRIVGINTILGVIVVAAGAGGRYL